MRETTNTTATARRLACTGKIILSMAIAMGTACAGLLAQSPLDSGPYAIQFPAGEPVGHALNPAQNLHAVIRPDGFTLQPAESDGKPWQLRYELRGVYRGDRRWLRATADPVLEFCQQGVLQDHCNGLKVEYINDRDGIRQNFLLDQALPGEGMVRVKLTATGSLYPVARGTRAVAMQEYQVPSGQGVDRLHYKDLRVFDADGRELEARMVVSRNPVAMGGGRWQSEIELLVDDRGATYPILIDPLSTAADWVVRGNAKYATLGGWVASAGDVNGDGFADVVMNAFGYSNGQVAEGQARVYHGSGSGLPSSPNWTAEGNLDTIYFGHPCAGAGDVNGDGYDDVVVGAQRYDNAHQDAGRAYVFHGSASGLGQTAAWTVESDQDGTYLGESVASAGDVNGDGFADVIVGAGSYDAGQLDEGRAYLYLGSASGLAPTPSWVAEGDQDSAFFGKRVAGAGDVNGDGYDDVIVANPSYDSGQQDEGKVFIYYGSAIGLPATPDWSAEGDQDSAFFGGSAASAGDVNGDGYADVLIGAHGYGGAFQNGGKAFLYLGSGAGLAAQPAWGFEGTEMDAHIAGSVSSAGDLNGDGFDDVVVGAGGVSMPGSGFNGAIAKPGKFYVFYGSASGLAATPGWEVENSPGEFYFGFSVAGAGDVNGDGFGDVVIGAPVDSLNFNFEGAAYAYYGSATGLQSIATEEEPFTGYFQQDSSNGAQWVAGECAGSILLPDGKTMWLFGRSYLESVGTNHQIGCGYQVSNCLLVQDDDSLDQFATLLNPDTSQADRSYFRPGGGSTAELQPGDGFVRGDSVFFFLSAQDSAGMFLDSNYIASCRYGGITIMVVQDVKGFADFDGIAFGTSVLEDPVSGYVYIFGSKAAASGNAPYLARLPLDNVWTRWEFFSRDSSGGHWDSLAAKASPVSSHLVAETYSVVQVQDSFFLFSEAPVDSGDCAAGKKIQAYRSSAVHGPYYDPQLVYQARDTIAGNLTQAFNVEVHPQFSNCDSLLISYNVDQGRDSTLSSGCASQCDSSAFREVDTWRPRFLRVPYSLIDPGLATLPLPLAEFDTLRSGNTWAFLNASWNSQSYFWDFGDGNTSTDKDPPAHSYALSGTYTVKLEVSNCVGTDRYFIDITTAGSSNVLFPELLVYPNPTHGQFRLSATRLDEGGAQIELLNLMGQRIQAREEKTTGGKLDLEIEVAAQPGIYLLRFSNGGHSVVRKLIVY